jgi:uncharacterized integral membrane protein
MSKDDRPIVVDPDVDVKAKHAISVKDYPRLDLEDDEYVVADTKRSVIGLVYIWAGVIVVAILFIIFAQFIFMSTASIEIKVLFGVCTYVGVLAAAAFGHLICWVYRNNFFITTNQRVVMRLQRTPFSRIVQSIELEHIEDVSYRREGFLQTVLDYGMIRASTVGDEHTYEFTFVGHPAEQIRPITRIVNIVDGGERPAYKKL